jgi:general secretion pathway protein D
MRSHAFKRIGLLGCLLLLLAVGPATYAQAPAPAPPGAAPAQGPTLDQETVDNLQRQGVKLNFEDVDIRVLARIISQLTGRNIVLDQKVQGKVTLVSATRVTTDEAWEMFVQALDSYGFGVEKVGHFYRVAPIATVNTKTAKIYPARARIQTAVIKLTHMQADQFVNMTRPLLSTTGVINGFANQNTVVVQDEAPVVARIIKLAHKLDQATTRPSLRVYYPHQVRAADVARNIEALFPDRNTLKITVHQPTNSLLVMATPEQHTMIERLLNSLERREQFPAETPQFFVYYLQYGQAEDLAKILAEMLQERQRLQQEAARGTPGAGGAAGSYGNVGNPGYNQTSPGGGNYPAGSAIPPGSQAVQSRADAAAESGPAAPTPFPSGADSVPATSNFPNTGAQTNTTQGLYASSKVSADPSNNALIFYVSAADWQVIHKLVEQLDIPRRQVLVQTIIAEVSLTHIYQTGINFQVLTPQGYISTFGGGQSLTSLVSILASGNFVVGGVSPTSTQVTVNGQTATFPNTYALAQFLQNNSDVNLIASPRLLTHNHKEADLKVGQVVPFATGVKFDINGQPIINFDYREVGLDLKMTPHISQEHSLRLELHESLQEVVDFFTSGVGAAAFSVPIISKREVNTEVSLEDGQTLVIGGLVQKKTINKIQKVPLLGDIPLLGDLLFKKTNKETDKTTLFLFITPYIIDSTQKMRDVTNQYNQMFEKKSYNDKEYVEHESYHAEKHAPEPVVDPNHVPIPGPVYPQPGPGGGMIIPPSIGTGPFPQSMPGQPDHPSSGMQHPVVYPATPSPQPTTQPPPNSYGPNIPDAPAFARPDGDSSMSRPNNPYLPPPGSAPPITSPHGH